MCSSVEDEVCVKFETNVEIEAPMWMELRLHKYVAFNRHFSEGMWEMFWEAQIK
jgi:hypothetical protein